jgi:hypothetical protein
MSRKPRASESMPIKGVVTTMQEEFYDTYNDFCVFEPPHIDVCITLCFAVLDYNRVAAKENPGSQMFLPFFEVLLHKISAATKI